MDKKNEPVRNRPADEGRDHDPNLRDESAAQPGVSTVSSSDTDEANEELTEYIKDPSPEDNRADRRFDEAND